MLIRSGHTLRVFHQPDKPQGRHAQLTPPPVKTEALRHCIPVRQPARIRSEEGVASCASSRRI
jgi:methionyl-tRNA formyltransferase